MTVDKSQYHSLSLMSTTCPPRSILSLSFASHKESRPVFQQPEPKSWSARTTIVLAIAASLLLGFIAGRFSSGLKPKLGWLDPDVLFVEMMWVILVAGALASVWPRKTPTKEESR
jgi:hypothetical protein